MLSDSAAGVSAVRRWVCADVQCSYALLERVKNAAAALSGSLDGLDYGPEALAELVGEVTKEQVVAVAKSVVCDLIYFLRGREDGEAKEDEADDED